MLIDSVRTSSSMVGAVAAMIIQRGGHKGKVNPPSLELPSEQDQNQSHLWHSAEWLTV